MQKTFEVGDQGDTMIGDGVKRCSVCRKVLPENHAGASCGLCAIGLTPISQDAVRAEFPANADGRVLAGTECPICHADLTLADLARRSCAICGGLLPSSLTDTALGQVRPGRVVPRPSQEPSSEVKAWPDDAPLW